MAKELPYFKFEPAEWDNGNIQMCSNEVKGIFIGICSSYWQRLGDLPYALALHMHCKGNAEALQVLEKHEIIQVDNEQIIIKFLDEQLNEFEKTSEKRRDAANKRWNDASALQVQSKSNARREEKRREEKKKVNKFTPPLMIDLKAYMNERIGNQLKANTEADKFMNFYDSKGWYVGKNKMKDWKAAVRNWTSGMNGTQTNQKPQLTISTVQKSDFQWPITDEQFQAVKKMKSSRGLNAVVRDRNLFQNYILGF